MSEELKPCPFCGGEASIVGKRYEAKFCVGCDDDSCLGFSGLGWLYDSEQEAAEAWNRRSERTCRIAWNDADRIVRSEDGGRMSEPNRDNVRTVSGNVGTASGIDRDALLKVADMLECDGECSESECGKGTFCEAPTIAAARISEELEVEL